MLVDVLSTSFVHPTEALLEDYCFKRIAEPALSALEEHLLICERCRTEVAETDEYIRLFKAASGDRLLSLDHGSRTKPYDFWLDFHPVPRLPVHGMHLAGMAVAAALLILLPLVSWERRQGEQNPTRIELVALRGGSPQHDVEETPQNVNLSRRGRLAKASSGKPLELAIDRQRLPAGQDFLLRVVNADGREAWNGRAAVSGNFLSAHLGKTLSPGVYWVRLYSERGELMSEYGLEID